MEQIKIDIVPVGVAPVAHASQFDNGRQIRFNLFNQGTPYTLTGAETVTMVVNGEEENITNTSDNYVIWDVAEEDCEKVGVIGCEIRIVLGSMLIGSKNFFLEVEMDPYDGKNIRIVTVGPADICTFEPTIAEPLVSVKTTLTPSLTGYTTVNVTRCGVNLWDEVAESGRYDTDTGIERPDASWTRSKNFIPVKSGSEIYIKSSLSVVIYCYGLDKSYISKTNRQNATFTVPSGVYYLHITWNDNAYNNDVSLNYPSTDTTYHAYTGNAYAISLGDTYYGGVLDVTRGKLSVTWGKTKLNELTGWQYRSEQFDVYIYGGFPCNTAGIPSYFICDSYPVKNTGHSGSYTGETCAWQGISATDALMLRIRDANYSDITSFLNAMGNAEVAYKLATPFDIDLTPVQIAAIVGQNNVFSDCGQTEVKYLTIE